MTICTTAYVSGYTKDRLLSKAAGEVILVHSTGVYLRFGTEVFLLCDKKWGLLPIGITVDHFDRTICSLQLEVGQPILRENGLIIFPGGSMRLCPLPETTDTLCTEKPNPEAILQAAEELAALQKTTGLSMLVLPIILGRPCDAALWQNPYFSRAHHCLDKLVNVIQRDEFDEIERNVKALLGLGTGLTPSADDIFMGMLYVFCRLHHGDFLGISLFQILIMKYSGTHTSQISAAYLKAILHGAPFERMEQVYRGVCGTELLNIDKLVQIGSNSGSEMLLGMLIALRICGYDVSKKERSQ